MKDDFTGIPARVTEGLYKKAKDLEVGEVFIYRGKTYEVIECRAEPHRNLYIDNCLTCAPFWGRYLVVVQG